MTRQSCVVERPKDGRQIETGNMRLWILLADFDAEQSVTSGNVEDVDGAAAAFKSDLAERTSQGGHEGPMLCAN